MFERLLTSPDALCVLVKGVVMKRVSVCDLSRLTQKITLTEICLYSSAKSKNNENTCGRNKKHTTEVIHNKRPMCSK